MNMIFFMAFCMEPEILNTTSSPWNNHDEETLTYAKKRCGEIYDDAPCVKLFKKYGKQDYSVICAAPSNVKTPPLPSHP